MGPAGDYWGHAPVAECSHLKDRGALLSRFKRWIRRLADSGLSRPAPNSVAPATTACLVDWLLSVAGTSIWPTVMPTTSATRLATDRAPLGLRSKPTTWTQILRTSIPPTTVSVGSVAPSAASRLPSSVPIFELKHPFYINIFNSIFVDVGINHKIYVINFASYVCRQQTLIKVGCSNTFIKWQ